MFTGAWRRLDAAARHIRQLSFGTAKIASPAIFDRSLLPHPRDNDVFHASPRLLKGLKLSKTAPRFRASVLQAASSNTEAESKTGAVRLPWGSYGTQRIPYTHIFLGCNELEP